MNKDLIEKIITICYKSKLKYDDKNIKVCEMRNYLNYLNNKDHKNLNNILNKILNLCEKPETLLVATSVYNLIGNEFPDDTKNYYQEKLVKEFINKNSS